MFDNPTEGNSWRFLLRFRVDLAVAPGGAFPRRAGGHVRLINRQIAQTDSNHLAASTRKELTLWKYIEDLAGLWKCEPHLDAELYL